MRSSVFFYSSNRATPSFFTVHFFKMIINWPLELKSRCKSVILGELLSELMVCLLKFSSQLMNFFPNTKP